MLRGTEEVAKTIPQDALLSFALAQIVALSAARAHPLSGRLWRRPFQEALLFLGAIFFPASYSFYHFWPDWSWLYLVDSAAVSPAFAALAYAGVVALGVAGYLFARWLLNAGRRRWVWASVAAASAGVVVIAALAGSRFTQVGTYDAFVAGKATPLLEAGPLFAHLGVVSLFVAAGLGLIIWGHRRRPPRESE